MVELSKGANTWLTEHDVTVDVNFPSGTTDMDLYTVLVRTHGSAGSDRDLVFFNQPNSVCGSVTTTGSTVQLRLDTVPPEVTSIVIAAALDDAAAGTIASRGTGTVTVHSPTGTQTVHTITGLTTERCAILIEIYRRDVGWKIRAVSQGWANGTVDLLTSYGITVDDHTTDEPTPESTVIIVPDEYAGSVR